MPSSQGIRAGAAYVELFVKDNRLVSGLRAAQQRLAAFGATVRSAGIKLLALGAGLGAPLVASLKVFADLGDSLAKMSDRTGISVEALSELGYAAEQSGTDVATLETSLRKMQKAIAGAANGSQAAVDALANLGLTAQQLQGLSPDEQFRQIAERISRIEDPALKAAAAMEIFGKSGTQLLPMIQDGAAGIRELEEEARRLGLTVSTEDARAAEYFGDRLDDLMKVIRRAAFTIGSALAPLVVELTQKITSVAVTVSNWIKQNKGLVVTVGKITAAVLAGGAALIVIGSLLGGMAAAFGAIASIITGVGSAIGLIGSALAFILSPLGLVIAGVVALSTYILTSTQAGAAAINWLGSVFRDLRDTATAAFKGIGDALAAGDIGLAARILWLTLKMEWQKGINFLNKHWQDWKAFFLRVFNEAVFSLAGIFTDAWAGMQVAWVESVAFMADAWTIFTSSLTKGWRSAQNFISKGVLRLMKLFDDSIDVEAASKILDEDMQRANRELDQEVNRTITESEQNRKSRRAEIESDRQGAQKALDDARAAEDRRIEGEQNKSLDESQRALDEARRAWQEAIDEAARKRSEAKDKVPPEFKPGRAAELLDETERRTVGVRGTFNAAAASALAGGDAADRTAKAVESMDKKLGKLVNEAQHGGLVFA